MARWKSESRGQEGSGVAIDELVDMLKIPKETP